MSYSRWGCDGSDVYVIAAGAGFECVGCEVSFPTYGGIIEHLREHQNRGENATHALRRLVDEADRVGMDKNWDDYNLLTAKGTT